ncbi:MAG: chromate transporter, partial [Bacillota bacterium]
IPLIQREIIERHGWLTLEQFIDVAAVAEMTPGPIAVNSATLVGFRMGGFWGSVAATLGVVAPSAMVVTVLAAALRRVKTVPWIESFFRGVRPAVVSLIAYAGLSVARSAVTSPQSLIIMLVILALLVKTKVHPILLVVLSGVAGIILF